MESVELWMKEYGEASRLADEISKMLSEHGSLAPSDPATDRHLLRLRTRIAILSARISNMEEHVARIPKKVIIWDKMMHKKKEMLSNLREREKQMASVLDMWYTIESVEDLPGSSKGSVDEERGFTAGSDIQRITDAQKEIMEEQDEMLDRFEETLLITKHLALAVNEELNYKARLMDNLDQRVETTDARLQRVNKRLKILNKRTKLGCSCICLLLLVLAIVMLTFIVWMLREYLFRQLPLGCAKNIFKYIFF